MRARVVRRVVGETILGSWFGTKVGVDKCVDVETGEILWEDLREVRVYVDILCSGQCHDESSCSKFSFFGVHHVQDHTSTED